MTRRGWVVLASDAAHYYEHMEKDRVFPIGLPSRRHARRLQDLRQLAASPAHIIPGHDPLVMQRYPAVSPKLEGIIVRLDVPPRAAS